MNIFKHHKGVNIYITPKGEFYCDAVSNSSEYYKKTFASDKLSSVEKAIEEFIGSVFDGLVYYKINTYSDMIKPVKVVRRIGSRLFFDDGTDTSNSDNKRLYPKEIDESLEFKQLKDLLTQKEQVRLKIQEYGKLERELLTQANKLVSQMSKVPVTAEP